MFNSLKDTYSANLKEQLFFQDKKFKTTNEISEHHSSQLGILERCQDLIFLVGLLIGQHFISMYTKLHCL